jgi:hypothetical protein
MFSNVVDAILRCSKHFLSHITSCSSHMKTWEDNTKHYRTTSIATKLDRFYPKNLSTDK